MELLISYLSRTTPIEFTFSGVNDDGGGGCFVVTFIGVSWGAFKYKQSAEKLLVKVKTRKTTRNIWSVALMLVHTLGDFSKGEILFFIRECCCVGSSLAIYSLHLMTFWIIVDRRRWLYCESKGGNSVAIEGDQRIKKYKLRLDTVTLQTTTTAESIEDC